MGAPSLASVVTALVVFAGLALVQALLSRRAHRATRDAVLELRVAMKRSFQLHHASLETVAKMIRAQPGERFSIELPHAPEFMSASAAAGAPAPAKPLKREDLDKAAPLALGAAQVPAPVPATSVDEPPKPPGGAASEVSGSTQSPAPLPEMSVDEPPESQRKTIVTEEPKTSRPTVASASRRRGLGAAPEVIAPAAQSRTRPKSPAPAQNGDDDFTAITEQRPVPPCPPAARFTPTRVSPRTPSLAEPGGD